MKHVIPFAALLTIVCATPAYAATCESLASTTMKDAMVTRAEVVAPGKFTPPDGGGRRGAAALTP